MIGAPSSEVAFTEDLDGMLFAFGAPARNDPVMSSVSEKAWIANRICPVSSSKIFIFCGCEHLFYARCRGQANGVREMFVVD